MLAFLPAARNVSAESLGTEIYSSAASSNGFAYRAITFHKSRVVVATYRVDVSPYLDFVSIDLLAAPISEPV